MRQLLQFQHFRIRKLLVSDSKDRMDDVGKAIFDLAATKKVKIEVVPSSVLHSMARNPQGFIAEVNPKMLLDLNGLENLAANVDTGVIVALDGVKDPQNLGSIIRACDSFGVSALVWSKNRNVSLTEVVSKVSAGASEFVECAQVSNLRDALLKLKKLGFSVESAIVDENASSLFDHKFMPRTVIVLGGESDGIQPLIAKESTTRLYIPQHGVVDSLNVGQAASVFLAAYRAQYK